MDPFILGKACQEKIQGRKISRKATQEACEFLGDASNRFVVEVMHSPGKYAQYDRLKLYDRTAFKNYQVRFMIGFFGEEEKLPSMRRDAAWDLLVKIMLRRAYAERIRDAVNL